ncbi:MAG: hypothetical protein HS122_13135 [Opitutaceae bacterium]|nr:hypothetical protein [Opitutaceae bacterium]
MPIPAFDTNNVLPPHLGNAISRADLSPYECTSIDLVARYATSAARASILRGFLDFRHKLQLRGLTIGYQWLDGSFLEDIEKLENRNPQDLDVLTVFWGYDSAFLNQLAGAFPAFIDPAESKRTYHLDHFPLWADESPWGAVENTRYWIQLFTHRRDGVWKGMLKIPLGSPADDDQARQDLNANFS